MAEGALDRSVNGAELARAGAGELRLDARQHQATLDAIPFPLFTKGLDLRYSGCNRAFEAFLGLTRERILGRSVFDVADPARASVYDEADRALLASGAPQRYEARVRHADGSERDVHFHKDVLRGEDGAVCGIVGVYVDLTETRRAEGARRALEEQLRHARNLESVGRLAGGVAHDLNNLLAPILGYAELLLADLPKASDAAEEVEAIREAALRARALIDRILIFSRKHVPDPCPCDVVEIVRRASSLLRGALRDDVRLELQLPARPVYVLGDALDLDRVLVNLAMNAQHAMERGGTLRVAVAIERALASPRERAVLEVSDDGVGMDAETQARAFEPYFTTRASGHGTGLGLATVKAIVEQHQGTVAVTSARGRGTTFRIELPGVEAPAPHPRRPQRPTLATARETLLLVEDEEIVRRMLRRALERQGYRVLATGSAEEALAAAASASRVDLLLSDVLLPGLDGKELHARLRVERPTLPVVYLSGHAGSVIADRGLAGDDVRLLRKPVGLAELHDAIRAALEL